MHIGHFPNLWRTISNTYSLEIILSSMPFSFGSLPKHYHGSKVILIVFFFGYIEYICENLHILFLVFFKKKLSSINNRGKIMLSRPFNLRWLWLALRRTGNLWSYYICIKMKSVISKIIWNTNIIALLLTAIQLAKLIHIS